MIENVKMWQAHALKISTNIFFSDTFNDKDSNDQNTLIINIYHSFLQFS